MSRNRPGSGYQPNPDPENPLDLSNPPCDCTGIMEAVPNSVPVKKMIIITSERAAVRRLIRRLDEAHTLAKELTRLPTSVPYGSVCRNARASLVIAKDAERKAIAQEFADASVKRLLEAHPNVDDHLSERVYLTAERYADSQLIWHKSLVVDGIIRSLTDCPSLD